MSMMLIALLAVSLLALQTETAQTATRQSDVDRLVRAAEGVAGTWPSQPPPRVPEVAVVVRHGKSVVPLLMALLSDDPHAERDRKRWKVQSRLARARAQGKRLGRRRSTAARRLDSCDGLTHVAAAAQLGVSVASIKRWRKAERGSGSETLQTAS
jgi:hypothetical protein